ncbi:aminotransferase class IV [Ruegeria meonggei]|uniref:Probable branched-chain-amino-acid aminotransferase n=1 Tax=Ruegeria meonggei TaxID=1446476 RepID=A0A1X6Z6U3_9RHOB|nr:aminotransferase class IV [Ruegeria meonggei]SLN40523.1 Branched-chain-amino-acid aminotransferase [Ruegeria meonggei]
MSKLPTLSQRHIDPRNYPPGVAYMDGQYLPMQEAKLSVLDYGFLHSDATYDVVHVWKGAFFRLDDHMNRFFRGIEELNMSIPYDQAQVVEILHNCVALSELQNAYVEFICTRGTSPTFSRDPRDAENRFIAFAIPFGSVANKEQMEHGLHLAVTDVLRIPPSSVDPTIKNYHWLDMVKGLYAAYDQGADTAVLVDGKGNVSEGPGFNVFAIRDGVVSTPDTSVLLGITRQTIFDICVRLGIQCRTKDVSVTDLKTADEVFVTSTAGGVMPVTKIDGQPVGSGVLGALSDTILAKYWEMHDDDTLRDVVLYPEAVEL